MTPEFNALYHASALLFDMDGTLVNSTVVVERTWKRFAERHNLDCEKILAMSHGRRTAETVALFAPPGIDLEEETARIVAEEVADTDGIIAVPGAIDLLSSLPRERWAVVTSANRELAERRMTAAGLPLPGIMIAAEDVTAGKPAPDGFLAAARALGAAPSDCLAFEDAPAGLRAAHASGAMVLAVATTLKQEDLADERWIPDFTVLRLREGSPGKIALAVAAAAGGGHGPSRDPRHSPGQNPGTATHG